MLRPHNPSRGPGVQCASIERLFLRLPGQERSSSWLGKGLLCTHLLGPEQKDRLMQGIYILQTLLLRL